MTKKHFQALAETIRDIVDNEARSQAAKAVAKACQCFNDRFDEKRFYKQCNIEG
jgi:hypothetical protein